jgi:xylulokinase
MDKMAMEVPAGSEGLMIFPYGNGAERTLENRNIGAAVRGWNFNVHDKTHFFRAAQEGIVFGLNYGLEIIRDIGIELKTVRAGHANMFLSPLFAGVFAALTDATVQLYDTDGSQGAARGAGFGVGIYKTLDEAFVGLKPLKTIEPDEKLRSVYNEIYGNWVSVLNSMLT